MEALVGTVGEEAEAMVAPMVPLATFIPRYVVTTLFTWGLDLVMRVVECAT